MFEKPSLVMRITITKSIGFVIGLIAFFVLPQWGVTDVWFRVGVVFYITIMGAMIGLLGVMTYHPVLRLPMAWWFRGPFIGGFMMWMLWMLAAPEMEMAAAGVFGADSLFAHGPWVILHGVVIGLIMSWTATFFGGEGKETVGR